MIEFRPYTKGIDEDRLVPLRQAAVRHLVRENQRLLLSVSNFVLGTVTKSDGQYTPHLTAISATVMDAGYDNRSGANRGFILAWWSDELSEHGDNYRRPGSQVSALVFNSHGKTRPGFADPPNTATNT